MSGDKAAKGLSTAAGIASMAGPWGAVAGGILGLGASLAKLFGKKKKPPAPPPPPTKYGVTTGSSNTAGVAAGMNPVAQQGLSMGAFQAAAPQIQPAVRQQQTNSLDRAKKSFLFQAAVNGDRIR